MKKFKLLSAIAMAGLLGLSARAALPSGFSSVSIKLTVLLQTNNTAVHSTTKFNVTKLKVTNKDVLQVVANEFTGTFPGAVVPTGAQLVLAGDGFFGGTFSVLAKDGAVLLANASSNTNEYELQISNNNNDIYTGGDTSTAETFTIVTAADFFWQDATAANFLEIFGPATVKDTFKASGDPESFKFSGAEDGFLGGRDAIVTGSVAGKGKDTADF
jgi:hypothetical protein